MTPAVFKWALGNNRAWASQAIKRNGKWYWYVAVYGLDPRGDCIGVAVADRPEGPWSDPIGKPLVGPGAGYIDPSAFMCIIYRVGKNIQNYLLHPVSVHHDRNARLFINPCREAGFPKRRAFRL